MILYNVTVAVDKEIEQEWLIWMKNAHIPEVMETNQFESFKFFKVMNTEDPKSSSYSVQYFADGMNNIQMYMAAFAPELQQKALLKWPNRIAAFRTLLESV
jgi:hypothetical protein